MRISGALIGEIESLASSAAPREICGLLAGTGDRAARFVPLPNQAGGTVSFHVNHDSIAAAYASIYALGETPLAFVHSHPADIAVPTPEDIESGAEIGLPHLIVSVLAGASPRAGLYHIFGGQALPERIEG